MRFSVSITLILVGFALRAGAADVARDPAVTVEADAAQHLSIVNGGTAAVLSFVSGAFTDLAPRYAGALEAAGFATDVIYDPSGLGDYDDYTLLLATSSDNWWPSPSYAAEIEAWSAYLDGGGRIIVIGQDFLHASGGHEFLRDYCGMESVTEDVNFGDGSELTWTGRGMLFGLAGSMPPCFEANPWFTDDVDGLNELCNWQTQASQYVYVGGCASERGIFSAVEFACASDSTDLLERVVGRMVDWLEASPVARCSLSAIKELY